MNFFRLHITSYDSIMYLILFRALYLTICKRILHLSLLLVDMQQGQSSSNRNFIVPQISTYEAGTFYYSAIKDWNGLPVNIKEIPNKDNFKDALKQFLKQQSRDCEEDSFVYF